MPQNLRERHNVGTETDLPVFCSISYTNSSRYQSTLSLTKLSNIYNNLINYKIY